MTLVSTCSRRLMLLLPLFTLVAAKILRYMHQIY